MSRFRYCSKCLQTIRVEVYYFPFDWCIGEALAKLAHRTLVFTPWD